MKRINYDYLWEAIKEGMILIKTTISTKKIKSNPETTLIIHTCGIGGIGDFFVCLPAIYSYIQKNKTDLLVLPQVEELAKSIKGVNNVLTKNSDIKKSYDNVYVIRINSWSSKMLKKIKFNGIRTSLSSIIKDNLRSFFTKSQLTQWRDLTYDILQIKKEKVNYKKIFNFSGKEKIINSPEMQDVGKKIIIHTGSGWHVKLWENEKWACLIKDINKLGKFNFIFVGGDEEKKAFEEIQKMVDFKINSLINKISIKELAIILNNSNYFIGIDSGPRNMANSFDIPSVGLPIVGQKIFMPPNDRHIIINADGKNDSLFFFLGKKTILQKLQPEEVLSAFKKIK